MRRLDLRCLAGLGAALALTACGRSPLDLAPVTRVPIIDAGLVDQPLPVDGGLDVAADAAPDAPPDLAPEARPEVHPDAPAEVAPPPPPPVDASPVCQPKPEACNGVDDDCNGKIDDGLPAIPCPNGGERYCVSGSYSACPRRCEVCVPGSQRECFTTFCTFWGTQSCASDGRSFGPCKEAKPPAECAGVADGSKRTPEIEKCCLAQGLCCVDEFDLDGDGDRTEMLGRCDSVTCGP